jgi:hypothetical protein
MCSCVHALHIAGCSIHPGFSPAKELKIEQQNSHVSLWRSLFV